MIQCKEEIKKAYKKKKIICRYCKEEMNYYISNYGCHIKCFRKHQTHIMAMLSISELEFFDIDKDVLYDEIKRSC